MKIEVGLAFPHDIVAFYMQPLDYHMLKIDGVPAAFGGYVRGDDGRLWAFLDTKPEVVRSGGMAVVKAVRAALDAVSEPVYVHCHAAKFATAERLLRVLGFAPTDEIIDEKRVWIWN